MTRYIVEAWHPNTSDASPITSARIMVRDYALGHKWRYKTHTNRSFDYAMGHSKTREDTVTQAIRIAIQKDPIYVAYGGETARGYLYIVTVSD